MKFLAAILSLIFSANVRAGISDNKVHFRAEGSIIHCDVDFGFHFNTKAPTSLEVNGKKYQPSTKEEKSIAFNTSAAGDDAFRLHFYVCDDALTICEPHDLDLRIYDHHIVQLASTVTPTEKSDVKPQNLANAANAKEATTNANGFIENQFDSALALAKKENKLLLVDFAAPWCPACLRLETESFNQKAFKTATAKYVKLTINVDLASNKALAESYSVKAIPTLIIMSSDQTELYRSVDFKTAQAFAKEFAKLNKDDLVSDEDLKKLAEEKHDQKAIWTLAKRYSDAMKFQDALDWFHKLKAPTPSQGLLAASAEANLLDDANEKDDKAKTETYTKLIKDYPDSLDAISWRNELAKILGQGAAQKEVLTQNIQKISHLLGQKSAMTKAFNETYEGDFTGFEKAQLLNQKIAAQKLLEDAKAVKATQAELLKNIHSRVLSLDRTGELLTAIYYLKACDQSTEVIDWYQKLIAKNPDNFVYYAKLANYENELKEYDKALEPAEKALAIGNELEFNNLKLLAQIQKSLGKNSDAQKSISRALSLPDAKQPKNKKLAQALIDMQRSLNQP